MLISITNDREKELFIEEYGGIDLREIVKCPSCKAVVAYWLSFGRFLNDVKLFHPTGPHTQIKCGVHPQSPTSAKVNNGLEEIFVFGLHCCKLNVLNTIANDYLIGEEFDLEREIVLRHNPEPEKGKGYFITLKEVNFIPGTKEFHAGRQLYLQTSKGCFYGILSFLHKL